MDLALVGNSDLRNAIRQNLVSFPSQIPALTKSAGVQERMVQLYFVFGWPMKFIADRYGLTKSGVRKLISEWKFRGIAAGWIQEIESEALAVLVGGEGPGLQDVFEQPHSDFAVSKSSWKFAPPSQPVPGASTGFIS